MAINLYTVTMGNQTWHYTSNETDVDSGGNTYTAKPISRQELTYDFKITNLKLTVPSSLYPFSIFKEAAPILPITVSISEYPSGTKKFEGKVLSIGFSAKKGEAVVSLGSVIALKNSTAPDRTFSLFCSFDLYDSECTMPKSGWEVTVPASEVFHTKLTYKHSDFANKPSGTFKFGYVFLDTGEAQYVSDHVNDELTLLGRLHTLDAASNFTVQAGCDKTIDTCRNKFGNEPNFGGFPFVPDTNPVTDGV